MTKRISLEKFILGLEAINLNWRLSKNQDGYKASVGLSVPGYEITSGLFNSPLDALKDALLKYHMATGSHHPFK